MNVLIEPFRNKGTEKGSAGRREGRGTNTAPEGTRAQRGFSLLEILVGLAVAGFLLAMVTRVVGQAALNDTVIREHSSMSGRIATLRRILHRDFQSIDLAEPMHFGPTGFEFVSTNTVLYDGPLPVHVAWVFENNRIERVESLQKDLNYEQRQVLLSDVRNLTFSAYDYKTSRERSQDSIMLGRTAFMPGSLTLVLEFESGTSMTITERIPHDYEQD